MNKRDTFYYWYFLVHIPITLLVDSCLVIPQESRYWVQQLVFNFHVHMNKDFLLEKPALWLQTFGWFEILVQLPIFFVAPLALARNSSKIYVVMTVYGFNAFLTTLVCLVYVLDKGEAHGLSVEETWNLFALYVPYLVIPLFMMVDCGWRVMRMLEQVKSKRE